MPYIDSQRYLPPEDPDSVERRPPVAYRNPRLVRAVLAHVQEANDLGDKPTWGELVDAYTSDTTTWKTAENVLYDLAKFGALQRHGRAGDRRHGDTRRLSITTLGRHWLAGTTPPPLAITPTED